MNVDASLMKRIFILGPAPFLIPLTIIWAIVCNQIGDGESQDSWRIFPLEACLAMVLIWHVALIAAEKNRGKYIRYALFHIPAYWIIYVLAVIFAVRFPL